eukprot:Lithocolla_globosa_v1_NODE_369_length_4280_cov_26.823000.p1 type:complete len:232 gc:universal NODE_369_length_4280_cov_26.823000:2348-3043(+)
MKSENSIIFLHSLFNFCFQNSVVPTVWLNNVIHPIPKDLKADQMYPLNYRGISLLSCVMKNYCKILNTRLMRWTEKIDILGEVFFLSIKSLYQNAKSAVRLNGMLTDWFPIEKGVKQGCLLSPLLFSMYINDLILDLRATSAGIKIDSDTIISSIFYADDIVLLAESESDLQLLLNTTHSWCQKWRMQINEKKQISYNIARNLNPKVKLNLTLARFPSTTNLNMCTSVPYS